ncbi:MAG: DUF4214 domain-containing protein [Paracoccaceae bacterium]
MEISQAYRAIFREEGSDAQIAFFQSFESFDEAVEAMIVEADSTVKAVRFYQTFFNRLPDDAGLDFWTGIIEDEPNFDDRDLAQAFFDSSEYATRFEGLTAQQSLTRIYQQTLGRQPDQAGLDFWTDYFDEVVAEQIAGGASQEEAEDFALSELGFFFAVAQETTETYAPLTQTFLTSLANGEEVERQQSLFALDDDDDGNVAIDGQTFQLTGESDTFAGTGNNDRFVALAGTLDDDDVLDGANGTDVLDATLLNADVAPSILDVEIVNIESRGQENEIDLSGTEDIERVNITGAADLTLSGLNGDLGIEHVLQSGFTGDLFTASFDDLGEDSELSVTLNSQDGTAIVLEGDGTLETLNLTSAGESNSIFLDSSVGVDEAIIGGAGDLTIITNATLFSGIGSIDASGLGGTFTAIVNVNEDGTIDASGVTGLDVLQITNTGEGAPAVTVTIDEGVDLVVDSDIGALDVTQLGAGAAGSFNDTQSITIDGEDEDGVEIGAITVDEVETIELTSTSSADLDDEDDEVENSVASIGGTDAEVVEISGDTDLVLGDVAGDLEVVDASAFTGDLTMDDNTRGSTLLVTGGSGDDTLLGGSDDDSITGGAGDDTIDGQDGDDELTGGAGLDTFVFSGGDDIVTDFTDGEDSIDGVDFGDATIEDVDGDAVISFDGDSLTLVGVSADDLDETDFEEFEAPETDDSDDGADMDDGDDMDMDDDMDMGGDDMDMEDDMDMGDSEDGGEEDMGDGDMGNQEPLDPIEEDMLM